MPTLRHLRDKEARHLVKEFTEKFPSAGEVLGSARNVEELLIDGNAALFFDGRPLILRTNAGLIPSLRFDEVVNTLSKVVVDMGAVAHVANGAHIMRPGIREIRGTFARAQLVAIVDEKFGKNVALGIADMDSESMRSASKGRVVTNVHYAGDKLWNSFTAVKPT